jgi:hypothetical protein
MFVLVVVAVKSYSREFKSNRSKVNKVVPEISSNVISVVDLVRQSLLTFSRGLELRRKTGLKIRVLVLSKFLAGVFFCHSWERHQLIANIIARIEKYSASTQNPGLLRIRHEFALITRQGVR